MQKTDLGAGKLADLARDASTLVDAREQMQALVETIWRLRQPDGCPWDREQTHRSIGKNMIEEAYEALDCIEADDATHLREELGDVLMQVVLHAADWLLTPASLHWPTWRVISMPSSSAVIRTCLAM